MSTVLSLPVRVPYPQPPRILSWMEPHHPLPRRMIWAPAGSSAAPIQAPPWLDTGPHDRPFDICTHAQRLSADIASRCAHLWHIDVSRILFAVTQARKGKLGGLQARLTPLRGQGGRPTQRRRGIVYEVQRYFVNGREMRYLLTLCLPRFLDANFDEKFITLFHELYHISPALDGDLRRHQGRYTVHSHSQRAYDRHMAALAREYLASAPNPALHAFLRLNFAQLCQRHGSVVGVVVPRPKLIPVGCR